jgi:hypothetical protein
LIHEPRRPTICLDGGSRPEPITPNSKQASEARKAALLSQVSALSDSSQPMDPKLQAELERLIRAEAQRTEQENFDWTCGMVVGVIVLVGFALFILTAMGAGH